MLKVFSTLLAAAMLFAGGCSGPREKPAPAAQTAFPETRYLTAAGSGETEIEARQQALAELSGIFESKVHSETTSFARSAIGPDQAEWFDKNVESKIAIVSSVQLTGAIVGRVWQDPAPGATYHALAVLDRVKAGRSWADELETVSTRTTAQARNLEITRGRFRRLLVLNRIMVGILRARALESRLRVVNYPARMSLDLDIGPISTELAHLRAQIRLFATFSGDGSQTVTNRILETFTENGLLMSTSPEGADALIQGQITIRPLDLKNPQAQFVRAAATVKIVETGTGAVIATLNENVRKGHSDRSEADRMAVSALADKLAERLVNDIGFGGESTTE